MDTKALVALLLAMLALRHSVISASPYFDEDDGDQQQFLQLQHEQEQPHSDAAYFDSTSDSNDLMDIVQKRSCIRRGGSCDHRRNDCCFSSSCRCNLWGSNCRCHRAGLFQKWG